MENLKVYNEEEFDLTYAKVNDLVEEEVIAGLLISRIPRCVRIDFLQFDQPCWTNGEGKEVFLTFVRLENYVWQYRGHCLIGEKTER